VYFIAVLAVGASARLGHSRNFVAMAIFPAGFCSSAARIAPIAWPRGLSDAVRAQGRLGARIGGSARWVAAGRRRAADREMEHAIRLMRATAALCAEWRSFPSVGLREWVEAARERSAGFFRPGLASVDDGRSTS